MNVVTVSQGNLADTSTDNFNLFTTLTSLRDLVAQVVEFGVIGDEKTIRKIVDEIRQVWSFLPADVEAAIGEFCNTDQAELKVIITEFERSLQFVLAWVKRFEPLMDNEYFTRSVEGMEYLIDSRLPPRWNWERDLLVLYGKQREKLAELATARGQKRIFIVRGRVTKKLLTEISEMPFYSGSNVPHDVQIIESPATDHQGAAIVKVVTALIQKTFKAHSQDKTQALFNRDLVLQRLINLPYSLNAECVEKMRFAISGYPVVIVSPGPSLEKNIALLEKGKSKVIIVATAQAVPALLKHNINPDYVVAIDPQNYADILRGMDFEKTQAIFLDGIAVEFLKFPFKRVFINFHSYTPEKVTKMYDARELNTFGSSVSVFAFNLMVELGACKVALIGQDLSYGQSMYYVGDGFNHCEYKINSAEYLAAFGKPFAVPKASFTLKGYYGGEVATSADYWIYHDQFMVTARNIKTSRSDLKIYNCTEGGAYIDGFLHEKLAIFLRDLKGLEMNKVDSFLTSFEKRSTSRAKPMNEYLTEVKEKSGEILHLTNEGFQVFSGKKCESKLPKIMSDLLKSIIDHYELSMMATRYLNNFDNRLKRNKILKNDNQIYQDIFGHISSDCKALIEASTEALNSLKSNINIREPL